MKRSCGVCGKEFDGRQDVKCCPECRKEGKHICSQCGRVYITQHRVYMCNACRSKRIREQTKEKKELETKKVLEAMARQSQNIDEKVAAARALGVSYGQYSAMRRGLLKM